jgi:hypothetical protein
MDTSELLGKPTKPTQEERRREVLPFLLPLVKVFVTSEHHPEGHAITSRALK